MPIYIHFKTKTIPQYKPLVQMEQDVKIVSPAEPKDVTLDDERTLLGRHRQGGLSRRDLGLGCPARPPPHPGGRRDRCRGRPGAQESPP